MVRKLWKSEKILIQNVKTYKYDLKMKNFVHSLIFENTLYNY